MKKLLSIFFILSITTTPTLANELDSTNFKIVGATTKGGSIGESTNYSVLTTIGDITADPRNYSTNYRLNQDPAHAFTANTSLLSCFETDTGIGESECTTGPAELTTGGMIAICGGDGCYNKARFEVDIQANPSDTLYSIQISEDNFVSDIRYIDGTTFLPETSTTHDINDYRTKTDWETETFNIKGLESQTTYYLRVTALHGDFTESETGPISSATTASSTLEFDIDIATNTGIDTETAPPYSIQFVGANQLLPGSAPMTAPSLIWLDIRSNAIGGVGILQKGDNGSLYSTTTSEEITSVTANLDLTREGYGFQSYYIDYDDTYPEYGALYATTDYDVTGNSVGIVDDTFSKIYYGDGPIELGRVGINIIARADPERTASNDYSESVVFVIVPYY